MIYEQNIIPTGQFPESFESLCDRCPADHEKWKQEGRKQEFKQQQLVET